MKKLFIPALTLCILITSLAACNGMALSQTGQSLTSSSLSTSAETKTVTVYSSHEADIVNTGIKEFQEKTGIKVIMVAAGTGELLKRVEAEKGNPLGDVFWGGGVDSLNAYSSNFESYKTIETLKIDSKFIDPNGIWTGESPLPMIIMYNKNLVAEADIPKSWTDLLDSKWKGKIAYADPVISGSAYTTLCTMLTAFGKDNGEGWEFIEKFLANLDGKIINGSTAVYKGVTEGEYSIGLTFEREAVKYVNSGAAVGVVYPAEGTSAVPEGIAIIKGARNMENAKAFIDFVMSRECQTMMAKAFGRRPARNDVEPPVNRKPLSEVKLLDYDISWAASQKEAIMAKWKELIIGS